MEFINFDSLRAKPNKAKKLFYFYLVLLVKLILQRFKLKIKQAHWKILLNIS